MKSIEINVPRNLIKKFYRHPEPYGDGDYVVDLINGMYTDVFYREIGDFITITNDKELISYLKKNKLRPREYFFRNGVFSLRNVADCDKELIEEWKKISSISIQLDLPNDHNLPSEFMFCFYWIEVGIASLKENRMTLDIYEKELIGMLDIAVVLNLLQK
ncbi:MAG: hypothetical protein CVV57_05620 [Tenericutes bacterium HGW-Tenericutes-2]|jgi:hypothetical protein|nr:MAG: hypothetical protein CVV57_05620 [Tenericutes bacterium HGW-Tenericutes-2]